MQLTVVFDGEELIAMSGARTRATANFHVIQSGAVFGSVKSGSAMLLEVSLKPQEVESRRQQYRNGRSERRRSLSSAGVERF